MNKIKLLAVLAVIVLIAVSCGKRVSKTYVEEQQPILAAYDAENFTGAMTEATTFVDRTEKEFPNDKYIALLELAKIELDAGAYDKAIKHLGSAEKRFLDIEGTIALSEEGSAIFLDDTTREYEAEPLEKLMIPPYLALAYWASGNFNGARIERNRTMGKVSEYIERGGEETAYLENPFARYLSAVIYENDGKAQDAKLEYNKIIKTVPALKATMEAEIKRLESKDKKSDLVVFVDLGKSPLKVEEKYSGKVPGVGGKEIWLDFVYAKYVERKNLTKKCRLLVDGKPAGETVMLYNLGQTMLAQYDKNKPKLIAALIKRAVTKVGAQAAGQAMQKSDNTAVKLIGFLADAGAKASSALERADLRGWVSLPATVHYLRANALGAGKHTIQLEYLNENGTVFGKSQPKTIEIKEGEVLATYFRVVK